jgi:hypothetical protein
MTYERGREIGTKERGYAVGRMGHGAADVLVADKGHTAEPSPWAGVTGREIGQALVSGRAAKPARAEVIPELIAREVISLVAVGNAVADAEPEPAMLSFFNGKPHAEGLKAYNEYLASKRAK